MNEPQPKQVRDLEWEFRNFFPSDRLRGLVQDEIASIRATYVEERLAWELQNRTIVQWLTLISILTLFALVGLVLFYFIHKWEERHKDGVLQRTWARIQNAKATDPF